MDHAAETLRQPPFCDENGMRLIAEQRARIAELERENAQLRSGRGPDDPAGCPGGNGEQCCGWHKACAEALKSGK